jgi:TRAP-type C4-dicarboxylate transport system permease large subunit
MVIAVIIGQVTPPMANQLCVFWANWPFLWGMVAFLLLIMLVPELATWLPSIARE